MLRDAVTADPGRPAITCYDDATGERVELSTTTLDNWVAKTANLLVDGLGAHAGGTVGLRLPCHWLAPVWLLAAWTAGQGVVLGAGADEADVLVVGPDDVELADSSAAGQVVALSLLPLGRPGPGPLPGRVVSYEAEVLGHGDRFTGTDLAAPDGVALLAGGARTGPALVEQARTRVAGLGLGPADRVLTTAAPLTIDDVVDLALLPLLTGGVVLCRHLDADRLDARVAEERVTRVLATSA
jgi:uncharacterized protein (TIGR03089 family)